MGLTQASSDASALRARQSSDSGNSSGLRALRRWLQAVESTETGLFRPRRADCRSWCCVRSASPRTALGLGPGASVAARIASCRQAVQGDGPQDFRRLRIKRRGRDRTAFSDRSDTSDSKRRRSSGRVETPDALGPREGCRHWVRGRRGTDACRKGLCPAFCDVRDRWGGCRNRRCRRWARSCCRRTRQSLRSIEASFHRARARQR